MKILTANDLLSGGVVFLTADGAWTPFISLAHISQNDDTARKLEISGEKAVSEQIIVEPFFIDITIENGAPRPVRFRERLRVSGPSVRSDFSKPFFREVA